MKKMILIAAMLVLWSAKYTESVQGVYYPNAYEVGCDTDDCLEALVVPAFVPEVVR